MPMLRISGMENKIPTAFNVLNVGLLLLRSYTASACSVALVATVSNIITNTT
jgi:hypothetical protein